MHEQKRRPLPHRLRISVRGGGRTSEGSGRPSRENVGWGSPRPPGQSTVNLVPGFNQPDLGGQRGAGSFGGEPAPTFLTQNFFPQTLLPQDLLP